MNEFQIFYTLVITMFIPTYPVTERFVTQSLGHYATELLCEEERDRKWEIYGTGGNYTLRCDPPDYESQN